MLSELGCMWACLAVPKGIVVFGVVVVELCVVIDGMCLSAAPLMCLRGKQVICGGLLRKSKTVLHVFGFILMGFDDKCAQMECL